MSAHLLREIEAIKRRIVLLSGLVEESVTLAVEAVERRDPEQAHKVIEGDHRIDRTEVEIEEECLKVLALYQPVAADLRFLIAVLKINNDLERIGDQAVNIAERALALSELPPLRVPFDLPTMADATRAMLRKALDALLTLDADQAAEVLAADDQVDELNREMYDLVKEAIRRAPQSIDALLHLLGVSRQLERTADLATNIAEDIIYMVQARIVRHGAPPEDLGAPGGLA